MGWTGPGRLSQGETRVRQLVPCISSRPPNFTRSQQLLTGGYTSGAARPPRPRLQFPTHLDNMSLTYSESVLDFTDHAGNLSHADAAKLLADHGCCLDDVYADNHGVSWLHLDARNAEVLLAWLGY